MDRGTATLLIGSAGSGKSSLAAQYVVAAAKAGERAAVYTFEERVDTLLERSEALGMPLQSHVDYLAFDGVGRSLLGRRRASENPRREMLLAARKRARLAGVPFDIEESDIEIPTTCPVLGIPLAISSGRRGPRDSSPTVDRLVPSRGYVRGNIIVVSWRANRLKSDGTLDELAQIVGYYRSLPTFAT